MGTRACAMCTAPTTIILSGGLKTWMKSRRPCQSRVELRSSRIASSTRARASSSSAKPPATLPRVTRAWAPEARSVASAVGSFSARASRRALRIARSISLDPLDEDLDLAAASEPDLPGLLVADAEIEQARLAVLDRGDGLAHDRTLDAATRDRALHDALRVDHELAADGAGRGAPGADDGRERDPAALRAPTLGEREDVLLVIAHSAFPPGVILRDAACSGSSG